MIQQINPIPVPQKAQAQATQPKEDTGDFEALMKKTVTELSGKQAESAKRKKDNEKNSNQQTDSADVPVEGIDISSLAAMLQQTIGPQLTVVETQAADKQQLSILQIVAAEATGSPSAEQEVSSLVGTMSGKAVSVQTSGSQPGAQQNSVFAITNTGKDASAAQKISPVISDSAQTLPGVNTAIPTKTPQASQQMEQSTESSEQSIFGAPQQAVTQSADSSAQPVMQTKQSADSSAQPVLGAQQKAVKQTEQSVDFSSQSVREAQQAVLATEEKTSTPVQETAYQNQTPARFSDLFQAGNVVIKVSDASSNVAKTTCNQVADNIAVNFKAGNPQFQMDLYPQNLGKVSVKLAMQSGVLTVEIIAANPKTQSMLMANTNEIKSMLQNTVSQPIQVLEPTHDKLWYQQQDQPNQSQQQQQQQQQNRNARSYLNALDSDITTDDFLSVMQQLRQQAYSL